MNRWTVHVTDFGKIKQADVEVAPLALFLGENNSGKSYLMTLVYGLLNVRFFFDGFQFDTESAAYRECCDVLDEMLDSIADTEEKLCVLNEAGQNSFAALLNEVLEQNKEKFLRTLFNREMKIGECSVSFPKMEDFVFLVNNQKGDDGAREYVGICGVRGENLLLSGYRVRREDVLRDRSNESFQFLLSYIMQTMLQFGFRGSGSARAVYLPTTRTGFLLTYKTLVGSAMGDKFNLQESEKNLLTRPYSDFLTSLSSMEMQKPRRRYQDVVEFVQQNVIHGHIGVSDLPAHDIVYTPLEGSCTLPMFVTSGAVTEVTPLLLFLQYANMGTLLIEEPEISLHLKLQWEMARVLIRLTNKGMPVFVTTHSDIILQHLNDMIRLSEQPDLEQILKDLEYEKEDLVSRDDVAVYQFEIQKSGKTEVKKLPCGDFGFEAMTFFDTLDKMNRQFQNVDHWEE